MIRFIAILLITLSLSGCGTIGSMIRYSNGAPASEVIMGGVRADGMIMQVDCLICGLVDLPFSLVGDILFLPYIGLCELARELEHVENNRTNR